VGDPITAASIAKVHDGCMAKSLRVLVITGGHPVDMDAFVAMYDVLAAERGCTCEHELQPDALRWLRPEYHGRWHAVVCHDIAGVTLRRGATPVVSEPDFELRAALVALLKRGQGMVITHHALASWPNWDGWATAVGGRYLFAPGTMRGHVVPSSGYRMATHSARVLVSDHPVCHGVEDFVLDDELYLCPMFDSEVVGLVETHADMGGELFHSTIDVMVGREPFRTCANHPPASRLLAWVKSAESSPLAYLQPGHGPETMSHPMYRPSTRAARCDHWARGARAV
jgi:uncharacterized protein